jgi:hypothetical protein
MQSDLERLLSKLVSTLHKPEVVIPWKPESAKWGGPTSGHVEAG